jgi:hypothetical protein
MGLSGAVEMSQCLIVLGFLIGYDPLQEGHSGLRYHSTMLLCRRLIATFLACALTVQPLRADDLPELGDVASNELSVSAEKKSASRSCTKSAGGNRHIWTMPTSRII